MPTAFLILLDTTMTAEALEFRLSLGKIVAVRTVFRAAQHAMLF
jgi:hypothetical protein